MQTRDERCRVGRRFLEAVILPPRAGWRGDPDGRIDNEMAELMRHHVEIERIWQEGSVGGWMRSNLHEPVTGVRIVDPRRDNDLKLGVVAGEMPFYGMAEIALPDVEHEADGPEHMGLAKLGRVERDCIEVPLFVRTDWAMDPPAVGRQIKFRRAQGACIDAIRIALVDREDEAHPLV